MKVHFKSNQSSEEVHTKNITPTQSPACLVQKTTVELLQIAKRNRDKQKFSTKPKLSQKVET